jgi:hypothetical protein
MSGVFISYRRQDSQMAAGRLADGLERRFGKAQIFRDVETIQPGVDFVDAIEGALSSCSAMLAVIGRRWNGAGEGGQSRLFDPNDWIRLEIAAALKRGIRVIPVLVEGALPPADADLPEDLKPLARRQAHTLSDERWDYDVQQLANALETVGVSGAANANAARSTTAVRPPAPEAKPQSSKLVKTLAWIGGIFIGLVIIAAVTNNGNNPPTLLASGTPTRGCGCWGYVNIGTSEPNPQCASGYHMAYACPAYCAAGGVQWQTRCM